MEQDDSDKKLQDIEKLKIAYNYKESDNLDSSSFDYYCNYEPMVSLIGEILVQVDDNDYQGDTRYLLRRPGEFGFLIVGWGSCSGCDALQGCDSWDDMYALYKDIEYGVIWKTREDMYKYMSSKDWKNTHLYSRSEENSEFTKKCLDILKEKNYTSFKEGFKNVKS